jgi:hypothetical protein
MQACVRNYVKPSVGRVVMSDRFQCVGVSSVSTVIVSRVILGCISVSLFVRRGAFFLIFFIACILLVEEAVTRTSKALIA